MRLLPEALTNISPPTKDIKSELDVTATNGPHLHLISKYILLQPPYRLQEMTTTATTNSYSQTNTLNIFLVISIFEQVGLNSKLI